MINFFKIKKIFSKNEYYKLINILFILLLCVLFELLSIGLLIPAVYLIVDPQNISNLSFLNRLFAISPDLSNNQNLIIYFFFIVYIIKNLFLIYFNKILSSFTEFLRLNISSKLFNHYLQLPYIEFIKKNSAIMMRNIFDDVVATTNFITSYLNLFVELLMFVIVLGVLFVFNLKITFFSLLIILSLSSIFYFISKEKIKTWGENRKEYTGKFLKTCLQSFNSIKELKLLNKERFYADKFFNDKYEAVKSSYLFRFISLLPRFVFEISAIIFFVLIFLLETFEYSKTDLVILISVYSYSLYRLLPAANKILLNYSNIKFRAPSVNNIINEFNLVDNKELIKERFAEKKNELEIKNFYNLSLKNLSFSYEKNKYLLKNINFQISKNDIIGIYGDSGSGKTTLINLLLGLLSPSDGRIVYNENIEFNSEIHSISKTIGCVFQSVNLWDDTILKNIALGCETNNIDKKKIDLAVQKSNLKKLIQSYDLGLNTGVGDHGVKLSGGQKQRIGLARALYFNPKILILDEATNSLDKNTEEKIMGDILKLVESDLTLIMISHNLEFLKNYSKKIYKLSDHTLKQTSIFNEKKL